ncbi:hypothetical protein OE88DRAFT_1685546 [Heliocybe sulcata]|uniref:Uncharacterized protein n=1 Tax=Heliocybe sulcata TaxID=5364 RepID=A0A5C3N1W3_9AGAM|nr:hypothetical protein OE88DRAFT_1685546 [Heliocybe sulcata]
MTARSHQVFAIARIGPGSGFSEEERSYRCVAALHHERCYGPLAVQAMLRCLVLVKQRENAEVVRAELRSIDGQYELPAIPCPYIAFVLGAAFSTDLGTAGRLYGTNISLLTADVGSTEAVSNTDGISIVDVTDPSNPAYCFVSQLRPLSAGEYIHMDAELEASLAALQAYEVVDRQALFESWPTEYGSEIFRQSIDILRAPDRKMLSLADLAIGPAMEYALQEDDFSGIVEALIMPGRVNIVRDYFNCMRPIPDSAIYLLHEVVSSLDGLAEGRLDLSDMWLSTEQILDIVVHVGDGVKSLNLSFNPNVMSDTVQSVIMALPQLRRLVVMGCSGLSGQDLAQLFRRERHLFSNMEALIHPFILSFDASPMNCLSVVTYSHGHGIARTTVPFATPLCIVQNLIDYLKIFITGHPDAFQMASSRPWIAWSAFGAAPKKMGQSWAERSLVCIPAFSTATMDGEGWMFLLSADGAMPQPRKTWGFIRFRESSQDNGMSEPSTEEIPSGGRSGDFTTVEDSGRTLEIHSFRSFLQIITADSRDEPSEDVVQELEQILDQLHQEQNMEIMDHRDVRQHLFDVLRR